MWFSSYLDGPEPEREATLWEGGPVWSAIRGEGGTDRSPRLRTPQWSDKRTIPRLTGVQPTVASPPRTGSLTAAQPTYITVRPSPESNSHEKGAVDCGTKSTHKKEKTAGA